MTKTLGFTIFVAAVGAALWWISAPVERPAAVPVGPAPAAQIEHADERPTSLPAATSGRSADPHVGNLSSRADFHNRVRSFFAQSAAMSKAEREAQAERLDADIAAYERARELSAGEALMLRLSLVHETSEGAEQERRMSALKERYEARTEQRRAAAQPDPMFELYKAREREIVAHVETMEFAPDGLTRDEYLRRRLQQEREALLGR